MHAAGPEKRSPRIIDIGATRLIWDRQFFCSLIVIQFTADHSRRRVASSTGCESCRLSAQPLRSVLRLSHPHPRISASSGQSARPNAQRASPRPDGASGEGLSATRTLRGARASCSQTPASSPPASSLSGRRGGCVPSHAWRHEAREQLRRLDGGAGARHRGQALGQGFSFAQCVDASVCGRLRAALTLSRETHRCCWCRLRGARQRAGWRAGTSHGQGCCGCTTCEAAREASCVRSWPGRDGHN